MFHFDPWPPPCSSKSIKVQSAPSSSNSKKNTEQHTHTNITYLMAWSLDVTWACSFSKFNRIHLLGGRRLVQGCRFFGRIVVPPLTLQRSSVPVPTWQLAVHTSVPRNLGRRHPWDSKVVHPVCTCGHGWHPPLQDDKTSKSFRSWSAEGPYLTQGTWRGPSYAIRCDWLWLQGPTDCAPSTSSVLQLTPWGSRWLLLQANWDNADFNLTTSYMAMGQNLVPLVNIKIAGKWMFIP